MAGALEQVAVVMALLASCLTPIVGATLLLAKQCLLFAWDSVRRVRVNLTVRSRNSVKLPQLRTVYLSTRRQVGIELLNRHGFVYILQLLQTR